MFFHDMKMLERVFWLKRIKGSGNPMHEATSTSGSFVTDVVAPLKKLLVSFVPKQDLHGYDKPWSGGAGKNKIIPLTISTMNNGVSIVCDAESETITLTGTATDSGGRGLHLTEVVTLTAGSYVLSVNGTHQGNYIVQNANGAVYISGSAFTLNETTDVFVGANVASGTAYSETVKLQIEAGSTATAWTPYSNICPISGHTEVDAAVCGKNLIDLTLDSTVSYTRQVLAKPISQDIVISALADNVVVSEAVWRVGVEYQDGSLEYVGDSGYSLGSFPKAFNATEANPIIALRYRGQTMTRGSYKLQLELGSSATSYEPYQGTSYTTDLGRTVYGGTLDVVSGELTVDRAMVDLGTLTWTYQSELERFNSTDISAMVKRPSGNSVAVNGISSCYEVKATNTVASTRSGIGVSTAGTIGVCDTRYTDIASFKSAVSGQTFCYELATPQTYQLTRQQINSLIGQNNIITEDGVEVSEVVYMTRLVGSPLLGSPQTEDEPTEETNEEPIEETEEPEGE